MNSGKPTPKMLQPACLFIVMILAWSAKGKSNGCGIIGSPVEISEAPFVVSVMQNDKHICNGVIYTMKFILTTSKCVKDRQISDLKVRAGSDRINKKGSLAPVCKRLIHGQARSKTFDSNLALLGLCEPLEQSDTIKDIKEVSTAPADGDEVTAFGWGTVSLWRKITICRDDSWMGLRKSAVQVYSVTSCAADRRGWYQPFARGVTELNICTSKPDKICSYDQGAPLISDKSLVGILSKGDCSKKPDVYSNLANHKDWLRSNTKGD